MQDRSPATRVSTRGSCPRRSVTSSSTRFKKADKVIGATNLANMDREITLYELAAMTRAGPAKASAFQRTTAASRPA